LIRLSPAEQLALIHTYQTTRSLAARDELVRSVAGLAFHAIAQYPQRAGLERDDLLAEARLGLLEACEDYDEARAVPFAVWALWQAKRRIRHALRATWSWARRCASLDEPAFREGDECELELLAVEATQESEAVGAQAAAFVRDAVVVSVRHNARLKELARRRLLAEVPETLAQVGQSMGVCRERVRQLEVVLCARVAWHLRGVGRAL
jgi:RNA polymerase sigma factor (sigma-70 family)